MRLAVIAAAFLLLPTSAVARDGLYAGELACGAAGSSPPFTQAVALALREGRAEWSRGTPDHNGYETTTLTARSDDTITAAGTYVVGGERRPLALTGRVEDRAIHAEGRRGPRDCRLTLARPVRSSARTDYRLPYDVDAIRRAHGAAPRPRPRPCPKPGATLRDLVMEAFYRSGDPTHSEIDPERLAAYRAAAEPLRTFERDVSTMADHALRSPPDVEAPSACVIALLDAWAGGGAMLGQVTPQGAYERKWSAITFALAFAESRAAAGEARARRIGAWLRDIGDRVAVHYMVPPTSGISDRANNHAYWAALSATATGLAAGDADQFDWGMARFIAALDDIDAEGFLTLELARASKALHYHRFSLEPMLLLALIARANDVKIPGARLAALRRLAARVRDGLEDPAPFVARTGKRQEVAGGDSGTREIARGDWVWAELDLALNPNAALAARIGSARPFVSRWLGGDLTQRYARP